MIGSRLPGFEGPPADSMMFVAEQVGASVDEQLSTADALDVKIGGLLALSVGVALTYLAIVIPLIPKFDVAAAVGTGLTFGYGFGCCFQALRGLRVGSYRRRSHPPPHPQLPPWAGTPPGPA